MLGRGCPDGGQLAFAAALATAVAIVGGSGVGAGCNAIFGVDELRYDATGGTGGVATTTGSSDCDNGAQDGAETDVDCGGVCEPCDNGQGCVAAKDCVSGYCAAGSCQACTSDEHCAALAGTTCNEQLGICVGSKARGEACESAHECASGFCPEQDGVCCDTPCALVCEACLASKTGSSDGVCDFAGLGSDPDPDDECPPEAEATCGSNGEGCAGNLTACVLWSADTVCEPASCVSGVARAEGVCDGQGTCVLGSTTSCSPYTCGATTCLTSCSAHSQCITSHYCAAPSCVPKKASGAACGSNAECLSGSCVGGYCA